MKEKKKEEPISIKDILGEYRKKEKELLDSLEPNKLYHRILPDFTDEERKRAKITFIYNRMMAFGVVEGNLLTIDRISFGEGSNKDEESVFVNKIKSEVEKGDIKVVFEL